MSTLIKVTVILLGLQMMAVLCLVTDKQIQEMNLAFQMLDDYLRDKVQSNDLGSNLAAANELIAKRSKKGCLLASFRRREKDIVKVAKQFVHLMNVGIKSDDRCTQETLSHLIDVSTSHSGQTDGKFAGGRNHLFMFKRIDELLDPHLETILKKCEQYYDEGYQQLLSKLDGKVKKQVEEIFSDSVLEEIDEMYHADRIIATTLAKKVDPANYKAALETEDQVKFEKYFKAFYKSQLLKPCRVYYQHFDKHYEIVSTIEEFAKRFKIPIEHSEGFALAFARYRECYLAGEFYDNDYRVTREAKDILRDYTDDVYLGQVDWNSTEKRWGWGRRTY